jgi:hypothetical protein
MLHISTWMRPHRIYSLCNISIECIKSERERHNCKCILWVRERINESFNKRILRNKMLKRQTNKLITVECFLTLHSANLFAFSLSLFSRAVIYWTVCRPSRKVEMRDKFNNQYFSNFNWNARCLLRKANELMRRKEKSKALSGFHFWIYPDW